MIELTGIKDIDELIYDYKYGCRYNPDKTHFNKVIQELNHKIGGYQHSIGQLKGWYVGFDDELHHYFENLMYYEIWEQ